MQTNIHVGRLLKEFELQTVGEHKDIKMVRLGLAVKRYLSQKSQTDFIYYVAFGKTAEMLSQYANQKVCRLNCTLIYKVATIKRPTVNLNIKRQI